MQCPIDGEMLVMADRNGVEIDYCPRCRGVWLDRGELDKIIDRSNATVSERRLGGHEDDRRPSDAYDHHRSEDYGHSHSNEQRHYDNSKDEKKRRRGTFLEDIFGGLGD